MNYPYNVIKCDWPICFDLKETIFEEMYEYFMFDALIFKINMKRCSTTHFTSIMWHFWLFNLMKDGQKKTDNIFD